ncbi:MAG TPA: succinate dehydrogenase, cytochrome b556 subunit [Acidobacteriota bacterium]|nr:succinate dehydrogenase, cytochrome b556 subunit [Acidobacteriota bacterium]
MQKRHKNYLGLPGWFFGGRYSVERYAYTLHRITGLAVLTYFIMHIFVTGSRAGGPEQWERTMALFHHPLFKIGEFMVFLAVIYHAANGIRLILVELANFVGKPGLPSYPYSNSTVRQRPLLIAVMAVAAIIMIFGGIDFYYLLLK